MLTPPPLPPLGSAQMLLQLTGDTLSTSEVVVFGSRGPSGEQQGLARYRL